MLLIVIYFIREERGIPKNEVNVIFENKLLRLCSTHQFHRDLPPEVHTRNLSWNLTGNARTITGVILKGAEIVNGVSRKRGGKHWRKSLIKRILAKYKAESYHSEVAEDVEYISAKKQNVLNDGTINSYLKMIKSLLSLPSGVAPRFVKLFWR